MLSGLDGTAEFVQGVGAANQTYDIVRCNLREGGGDVELTLNHHLFCQASGFVLFKLDGFLHTLFRFEGSCARPWFGRSVGINFYARTLAGCRQDRGTSGRQTGQDLQVDRAEADAGAQVGRLWKFKASGVDAWVVAGKAGADLEGD